jgi:predicted RNase H-like HicB family nuclease
MKYVAIIVKTGNGYSAHLPDIPCCIAAADTFEETRDLIQEAAIFHLEGMVEDGDPIPEPVSAAVEVEVQVPSPAVS